MKKLLAKAWKSSKKKILTVTASLSVMAMMAAASFAAPSTGNSDVDAILSEMESGFTTAKTAFIYLAIAAVPITLIVVLFFWLRGKFKQSVSGA